MQVDRIQSPGFGNVYIPPEALPALKKASKETIQLIDRVGEDLKDVVEPVLRLNKQLKAELIWKDGFMQTGPFRQQKPNDWTRGNFLYWARQNSDDTGKILTPGKTKRYKFIAKLPTYQHAINAYARMKNYTDLERAAEIVKITEGIYDGSSKVTATKFISNAEDLFEKYSR